MIHEADYIHVGNTFFIVRIKKPADSQPTIRVWIYSKNVVNNGIVDITTSYTFCAKFYLNRVVISVIRLFQQHIRC